MLGQSLDIEKHKSLQGENTTERPANDLAYKNSLCIGRTSLETVRIWISPSDNFSSFFNDC